MALNMSFQNVQPLSDKRLIVTLDLRRGDSKRRVFNMEHVNCIEAMACLALGAVKQTENTRVFTFSSKLERLIDVKLHRDDTYETAFEKCNTLLVSGL